MELQVRKNEREQGVVDAIKKLNIEQVIQVILPKRVQRQQRPSHLEPLQSLRRHLIHRTNVHPITSPLRPILKILLKEELAKTIRAKSPNQRQILRPPAQISKLHQGHHRFGQLTLERR